MLAGCGGSQTAGVAIPQSAAATGLTAEKTHARYAYRVLYSFKGSPDGEDPQAGLINVNGTLYGTTQLGGSNPRGGGTVFAITTSGAESLLHSFGYRHDGASPVASLFNIKGTLYGTTASGGTKGYGTVFSLKLGSTEKVLHNFLTNAGDGANPEAGLIGLNGTLYGTTAYAGAYCNPLAMACGTVFSITPLGTETVLHSFGRSGDGAGPYSNLINVKGTLYGTTAHGGANCAYYEICGTVFSISPSGTETVLHSFGKSGDGEAPTAGLVNVSGTLYGTTADGGAGVCNCGTVFKITPSGSEAVVHSFGPTSAGGAFPRAGLINFKGTLYGTTYDGGNCKSSTIGCGTVFAITTSGKETVIHNFAGGSSDGKYPDARLVNVKGTLYGTTDWGGADNKGTVFALSP
jgi:uncharacterized repeat protein (TIGR03803 family)